MPVFCSRRANVVLSLILGAITLFVLEACGTLPNGRGWGQDAIYPFDLDRIGRAAYSSAIDPQTWIPLAAGAAVNPFDHRISDWARVHTPIFGSQGNAESVDTTLLPPLEYEWIATGLATPSGDSAGEWIYDKAKGMAVEWSTVIANANATLFLKKEIGRERPNESDDRSMPSSAASDAFNYATLSNGNLDNIPALPDSVRVFMQAGNIVTASTIAWARVEAGDHYPSDVLAGAALGHFVTSFICKAFMGLPEGTAQFSVSPSKQGVMVGLSMAW